jgi:hypothetical protein
MTLANRGSSEDEGWSSPDLNLLLPRSGTTEWEAPMGAVCEATLNSHCLSGGSSRWLRHHVARPSSGPFFLPQRSQRDTEEDKKSTEGSGEDAEFGCLSPSTSSGQALLVPPSVSLRDLCGKKEEGASSIQTAGFAADDCPLLAHWLGHDLGGARWDWVRRRLATRPPDKHSRGSRDRTHHLHRRIL